MAPNNRAVEFPKNVEAEFRRDQPLCQSNAGRMCPETKEALHSLGLKSEYLGNLGDGDGANPTTPPKLDNWIEYDRINMGGQWFGLVLMP